MGAPNLAHLKAARGWRPISKFALNETAATQETRELQEKISMSDKDFDALREQLAEFTRRLDAKIQEFHDRGAFADTHEAFVARIRQGHAAVETKLEAAVHGCAGGAATGYEIKRDLNALIEDFGHLEVRLNAESMKR
jgi:hypothetical protein